MPFRISQPDPDLVYPKQLATFLTLCHLDSLYETHSYTYAGSLLAVLSLLPQGQKHFRLKAKKRKSGEPNYYVSLEKPSRKRLGRLYGSDKAAAVEFFQDMEKAVENRGAEATLRLNVRAVHHIPCLVLRYQLISEEGLGVILGRGHIVQPEPASLTHALHLFLPCLAPQHTSLHQAYG